MTGNSLWYLLIAYTYVDVFLDERLDYIKSVIVKGVHAENM